MVRFKAASLMSPEKCPRSVGKSFSRLTSFNFFVISSFGLFSGIFSTASCEIFSLFCDVQGNSLGSLNYVEIRLVFFVASFFFFRLEAPDGYLRFISLRPLLFTLAIHLTKISHMRLNQQRSHNLL